MRTIVKLSKLKDPQVILNLVATRSTDPDDPGSGEEWVMDFNKIIPEPRTIEECPDDYIIESAKEAHIQEDEERPWFDWYRWHRDYWGVKWPAYDGYSIIGKSYIEFVFSTPWNLAYPVIHKLDLLGCNIDVKYADEDTGHNCGKLSYTPEQDWTYEDESTLKDPIRFANRVWER